MSIDLKALALPFHESEIEWRIGQCGKKGNGQIWATCLAYVQARAIMNRLDDVCSPENWRVGYSFISEARGVIAKLSIYVGDLWITKEDGAEQTDIESFKGGISSALKRAGSAWGIGRYLYGLEQGFAQIVEDRTGAYWAKTKDGAEFYWKPPRLPQWALPAGDKADTNGVHPQQPGENDGIQEDGIKIPYGPLAGQFVHNADPVKLRDYILELEASWKRRNLKDPPNWAKPLVAAAEPIIAAFENRGVQ